MDELETAIEDAQLRFAMNDLPMPTMKWDVIPPDEMWGCDESLEEICSNCLGLHLLHIFLKEKAASALTNFLFDVINFRNSSSRDRLYSFKIIVDAYLMPREVCGADGVVSVKGSNGMTDLVEARRFYSRDIPRDRKLDEISDIKQFFDSSRSKKEFNNALNMEIKVFSHLLDPPEQYSPSNVPPQDTFDDIALYVFRYLDAMYTSKFKQSTYFERYRYFTTMSTRAVKENDFSLFRVLGRGGFGLVSACKRCQSGHLYALKMMDRKRIKHKKSEKLCINERNILAEMKSDFVVCLKYAFSTPTDIYLVLDLMVGGDLGYHLSRKGIFTQRESKYYIARTILGIKALHEKRIVYRDVKPENILMDGNGRTKISDMGLAARMPSDGLKGVYGTRGYWAPEMLKRTAEGKRISYQLSVDWFSLGCLLYEFVHGKCPFRTEVAKTWGLEALAKLDKSNDALSGRSEPEVPKEKKDDKRSQYNIDLAIDQAVMGMEPEFDRALFSDSAISLISGLLTKDPAQRLGANGAEEIMAHPFFSDISWDEYVCDSVLPPTVPRKDLNYSSQNEIGDFVPLSKIEFTDSDLAVFNDWSYISKDAFLEEVVGYLRYEEEHVR